MIRQARLGDLEAIEAIVRDAFSVYLPRMDRPPGPMLSDYRVHIERSEAFVLEENGRTLGLSVMFPGQGHLLLDLVAVAPSAQGKGVGRRLVAHAIEQARLHGQPEVRLYTNEAMHETLPFYRSLGFVETNRILESGYRRVYMTKPVGEPPP